MLKHRAENSLQTCPKHINVRSEQPMHKARPQTFPSSRDGEPRFFFVRRTGSLTAASRFSGGCGRRFHGRTRSSMIRVRPNRVFLLVYGPAAVNTVASLDVPGRPFRVESELPRLDDLSSKLGASLVALPRVPSLPGSSSTESERTTFILGERGIPRRPLFRLLGGGETEKIPGSAHYEAHAAMSCASFVFVTGGRRGGATSPTDGLLRHDSYTPTRFSDWDFLVSGGLG